ncbi:hypothetical protein [Aggregatilinea lenta]|uniref:hypothetical protein n=1 Tax=Aggregatilinea lenta TaxID=913108 RepID=UPI000E5AD76F|nr:hypothetical protein [Aggregatilinea lenta]
MKVRPQVAALIVLLVVMGFVFVLVGEAGVSTDAIKPTATVAPTADGEASASSGTAANWVESTPGTLTYAADAERDAAVQYLVGAVATVAGQIGAQAPADDSTYPLLDVTQQLGDAVVGQLGQIGLTYDETPPAIQMIGDVPTAVVRFNIPPQTMTTGENYPGFDLAYLLIGGGDESAAFLYQVSGEVDETIYQDFLAWLAENGAALVTPEAQPTAEATESAPEATAAAPVATEDANPAATEEAPEPAATAPVPDVLEPIETEAAPDLTETAPDAAVTAEPEAGGTAETTSDWIEVQEGALMYAVDPSITAQISYTLATADQMVDPEQLATLPEDPTELAAAILQTVREGHMTQVASAGIIVEDDAYRGPDVVEIEGQTGATLRVVIAPQMVNGQEYPGVDQELAIFPREDGWVLTVSYMQQGDPNAEVYASYRAWLEDNMDDLIALEAPEAESTAEATEVPADAAAPTVDATGAAD